MMGEMDEKIASIKLGHIGLIMVTVGEMVFCFAHKKWFVVKLYQPFFTYAENCEFWRQDVDQTRIDQSHPQQSGDGYHQKNASKIIEKFLSVFCSRQVLWEGF
jgi:hypothetical protein